LADYIKFLGTAGGRFVVATQLRYSAGTWLSLSGQNIMLDPGPGTLVRCWASRPKLDPRKLDAIIISHHHIDHCTDANVLVEAMTGGGHQQRGVLFASLQALESDSPLCRYMQSFPERTVPLTEDGQYALGRLRFSTVVHRHGVETYGLIFESEGKRLGFVVDTAYFDELAGHYQNCDLLIINVVLVEKDHPATDRHLSLWHAEQIIQQAQRAQAILTHFGMGVLQNKPWQIAADMSQRLGRDIQAARDGMKVKL